MRSLILAAASAVILAACASSTPAPEKTVATPAPTAVAAPKAPQCYNGDSGKFEDIGTKAAISGVNVVCQATADGKGAQWMGVKKAK